MTRENIINKLIEIVKCFVQSNAVEEFKIDEDDNLIQEEFGIDSINFIKIIIEIERIFDIEIEDDYITMGNIKSVGDFADIIYEYLQNNV